MEIIKLEKVDPEYITIFQIAGSKTVIEFPKYTKRDLSQMPYIDMMIDIITYDSMLKIFDDFTDDYFTVSKRLDTLLKFSKMDWDNIGRLIFNDAASVFHISDCQPYINEYAIAAAAIADVYSSETKRGLVFDSYNFTECMHRLQGDRIIDITSASAKAALVIAKSIDRLLGTLTGPHTWNPRLHLHVNQYKVPDLIN